MVASELTSGVGRGTTVMMRKGGSAPPRVRMSPAGVTVTIATARDGQRRFVLDPSLVCAVHPPSAGLPCWRAWVAWNHGGLGTTVGARSRETLGAPLWGRSWRGGTARFAPDKQVLTRRERPLVPAVRARADPS